MTEKTKIQATIDAMTTAFAAHDIDGIMKTYEPDAVVVGQPETPISGVVSLREMFAGFLALEPKFTFINHEIFVAGDIALHLNNWTMTGAAPDGANVEMVGLSAVVLRKQKDGKWLMVIDNPFGDFLLKK